MPKIWQKMKKSLVQLASNLFSQVLRVPKTPVSGRSSATIYLFYFLKYLLWVKYFLFSVGSQISSCRCGPGCVWSVWGYFKKLNHSIINCWFVKKNNRKIQHQFMKFTKNSWNWFSTEKITINYEIYHKYLRCESALGFT